MHKPYQLNLNLATKEEIWQSWAFVNKRSREITSCSRQAKALGISTGMDYEEALTLLPEMRVLVLDGHR